MTGWTRAAPKGVDWRELQRRLREGPALTAALAGTYCATGPALEIFDGYAQAAATKHADDRALPMPGRNAFVGIVREVIEISGGILVGFPLKHCVGTKLREFKGLGDGSSLSGIADDSAVPGVTGQVFAALKHLLVQHVVGGATHRFFALQVSEELAQPQI